MSERDERIEVRAVLGAAAATVAAVADGVFPASTVLDDAQVMDLLDVVERLQRLAERIGRG